MADLDMTTELWVLRAKVKAYETALAEAMESDKANAEDAINAASECEHLREGVRGFALTLRSWAVAAGGHTPSAIIASRLLELIGDEKPIDTTGEAAPAANAISAETLTDAQIRDVLANAKPEDTFDGRHVVAMCNEALGLAHLHGSTVAASKRRIAAYLITHPTTRTSEGE